MGGGNVVVEVLDGYVAVTNDSAALQSLRAGVVSAYGIGERAGNEVGKLHLDVELSVGRNVLTWAGEEDDCRYHVVIGGNFAHDDAVARPARHLGSVGLGLSGTEIDEVCWITIIVSIVLNRRSIRLT